MGERNAFITSSALEASALQNYDIVSALAVNRIKAAFRNASRKEKSELWRTHLALFLVNHPELSELQKEVVLEAMALATPVWFEARSDGQKSRVDVRLHSLEERIVAAFSKEERVRVFATLGGEAAQCATSLNQRSTVLLNTLNYNATSNLGASNRWTNLGPVRQDMQLATSDCQCSTESDWCPMFGVCTFGNCTSTNSGCGTLWSYSCDGSCRNVKPTPSPSPSPKTSPRPLQEAHDS